MRFLELYGKSMHSLASIMKHHPLNTEKNKVQWALMLEIDYR